MNQQELRDNAEKCIRENDFRNALSKWEIYRGQFPKSPEGYTRAAVAAMQLNDLDMAERICAAGLETVSDSFDIRSTLIDCALRIRSYDKALERARELVKKFPGRALSWRRLADIQVILAEYVSAQETIMEGLEHCGKAVELMAGYARIANAQLDYDEAAKRWKLFSVQFPTNVYGYTMQAMAQADMYKIDEAEELCLAAMEKVEKSPDGFIQYAEMAMRRRDFEEALKRWEVVRTKFSWHAAGYVRAASALWELGQRDEAEAICKLGTEKTPRAIDCWNFFADLAMRKRDYDTVIRRCMDIIGKFPHLHNGYTKAAYAFMATLDFTNAEMLANAAIQHAPNAVESWVCHADWAARSGRMEEALTRRRTMMESFPRSTNGYLAVVNTFMAFCEYEEAEAVSQQAIATFPYTPSVWIRYAQIARDRYDMDESKRRWAEFRRRFPYQSTGWRQGAIVCMDDYFFDEAEELLKDAKEIFPDSMDTLLLACDIALRKRDQDGIFKATADLCDKFPRNPHSWIKRYSAYNFIKDYDSAEDCAARAIQVAPYNAIGWNSYAEVARLKNDLSEATARFESMRLQFPFDMAPHIRLVDLALLRQDITVAESIACQVTNMYKNVPCAIKFVYHIKLKILMHQNKLTEALEIAECIYNKYKECRSQPTLVYMINESLNGFVKELYKEKKDFINNNLIIFAIYVLFTNNFSINDGMLFRTIEMWTYSIKKDSILQLIDNAINIYNINNLFTPFFTKEYNRQCIIDMLDYLLEINYKGLFRLCNFSNYQTIIIEHLLSIYQEKSYLRYDDKRLYTFVKLLHFYDSEKAWNVTREVTRREYVRRSNPIGMLSNRYRCRLELTGTSFSSLLTKCNKLSVGICVSGQLRGYEKSFKALLNAFDFKNHEYHVYVHTWRNIGRKFPKYTHAYRVFHGCMLGAYLQIVRGKDASVFLLNNYPNLFNLLKENSFIDETTIKNFYNADTVVIENDEAYPYNNFTNAEKMYYKIEKCNNLAKTHKHDLIIRTRPDFHLKSSNTLSLLDIYNESQKYGCIFTPLGYYALPAAGENYEITDAFAIGTQQYMNIYSDTYSIFTKSVKRDNDYRCLRFLWAHSALSYTLFSRGVDVRSITLSSALVDADMLTTLAIYEAIQKDVAVRSKPTEADQLLLEACEKDLAAESKKAQAKS